MSELLHAADRSGRNSSNRRTTRTEAEIRRRRGWQALAGAVAVALGSHKVLATDFWQGTLNSDSSWQSTAGTYTLADPNAATYQVGDLVDFYGTGSTSGGNNPFRSSAGSSAVNEYIVSISGTTLELSGTPGGTPSNAHSTTTAGVSYQYDDWLNPNNWSTMPDSSGATATFNSGVAANIPGVLIGGGGSLNGNVTVGYISMSSGSGTLDFISGGNGTALNTLVFATPGSTSTPEVIQGTSSTRPLLFGSTGGFALAIGGTQGLIIVGQTGGTVSGSGLGATSTNSPDRVDFETMNFTNFTGSKGIIVQQGELGLQLSTSIGSGTSADQNVTVGNSASFTGGLLAGLSLGSAQTVAQLNGNSQGRIWTQSGGSILTLTVGGNNATGGNYGGIIGTDFTSTIGTAGSINLATTGNGTQTISGLIVGAGSVTVNGAGGALILSGSNTYTGTTTVAAGSLIAGVSNFGTTNGAFGPSADAVTLGAASGTLNAAVLTNGSITVSNPITVAAGDSGILSIGGNTNNSSTFSGAITVNSNLTLSQTATSGGHSLYITGGITGGTSTPQTVTFAGPGTISVNANPITDYSGGGGTVSLAVTGGGAVINTTNTYSGGTTFGGGTLYLGTAGAIGTTGTLSFTGGTLQYSLSNQTDYSARFNANGGQAFSIDTNGQTVSFATPLVGSGSSLALVDRLGTGTLLIPSTSTYTGATTVTAGTLDVTGALSNSGTINVSAGNLPATLILDGATALPATAIVTGTTTGTAIPVITVNNGQTIASIGSVGTTTFTAGTSIVGTGNGVGTGAGGGSTSGGISGTGTLTVNGTANLYAANINQSVLNIGSSSTVTIADSASPGNASSVSVLTDLNNSGTFDLNNNDLIVTDSAQYSTIKALINNAADGGAWDQSGITSSSARANSSAYGLGYAPASSIGTTVFDGVTLAGTETIVKYTLLGDTQLRGAVGIGDYDTVLSNYGTGTDWSQGNFHYSGVVGIGDYDDVLSNYGSHPTGNLVVNPALTHSLSPVLSLSPAAAKSDLKLEVNTTTGDVYLEANTSVAFTGYTISDPSAHLLGGSTSPDPAKLLSVSPGNGGNTNAYETGTTYINWFKISETSIQMSEGQNNNGFANHSSRDDTINIPAGGTIDFGDIYNTAVNNQDISFDFAEAGTTPTNGPAYYGAEVDYVGGVSTPEPASVSLLAIGAVGMLARRRRRGV